MAFRPLVDAGDLRRTACRLRTFGDAIRFRLKECKP